MPFNLSLVLLFAVTAAVAEVDWNIRDEAILPKLKTLLGTVDEAKNGNVVGFQLFCGNIAVCIVEISDDDYRLYAFNFEKEALYKDVNIRASSLDKVKVIGEDLFSTCGANGPIGAAATSEAGLLHLWETDRENGQFAALFRYEEHTFGFTGCAIVKECSDDGVMSKTVKRLATYGYSQRIVDEPSARASLDKYLANNGAFGNVILLPALYSGVEKLAEDAFKAKYGEISGKLGRRLNFTALTLRNAWSVSGNKKCVALFSYMSTKLLRETYVFVSYESSITESKISLTGEPLIGGFAKTEGQTMMGVVDYLKANHISGYISAFDINEVKTEAGKLVLAADYAARKYTEMDIEGIDRIPFANRLFTVAKLVQEASGTRSWHQYASILLHDAIVQEAVSPEELETAFGLKVKELAERKIRSIPSPSKQVQNAYLKFLAVNILAEGKRIALSAVLEERRKKTTKGTPPSFSIRLTSTFSRGKKVTGVYELVELGEKANKLHFRVEIHHEGTTEASIVIGELHQDMSSFRGSDIEENNIAAGYTAYFEELRKQQHAFPRVSNNSHVAMVITCLEFAARKHYKGRRRDYSESPHLNHVIAVARILIVEGEIEEIEIILAAFAHDTLEDTSAVPEEVEFVTNEISAGYVVEVTDAATTAEGTEAQSEQKKALQNEHAKKQSPGAVLVKMADRIYNLRDFGRHCAFKYTETRRRWQFTNAQKLLDAFIENTELHPDKWTPIYIKAFKKLANILQTIINEHTLSLTAAVAL